MDINDVKTTDIMEQKAFAIYRNRHARINAVSAIENEVFKEFHGRYPDVIEIWDFDCCIAEKAREIEMTLFKKYLKTI